MTSYVTPAGKSTDDYVTAIDWARSYASDVVGQWTGCDPVEPGDAERQLRAHWNDGRGDQNDEFVTLVAREIERMR